MNTSTLPNVAGACKMYLPLLAVMIGSTLSSAQQRHSTAAVLVNPRTSSCSDPALVVRRDQVGADYRAAAAGRFQRLAIETSKGWEVRITAADGTLRMKGMYADAQLTVPHGCFTYYHANGETESEGCFANGLKTGAWSRYDADGEERAERIYDGRSHDELASRYGWNNTYASR